MGWPASAAGLQYCKKEEAVRSYSNLIETGLDTFHCNIPMNHDDFFADSKYVRVVESQ